MVPSYQNGTTLLEKMVSMLHSFFKNNKIGDKVIIFYEKKNGIQTRWSLGKNEND